MTAVLEIDGKEMYPIKDAVKVVSYSRDYITKLARDKKIRASHVGRNWYVDLESLKSYEESAALEQEIRKRKLSEERIRERDLRADLDKLDDSAAVKVAKSRRHAVVAAAFVLMTGTLGGVLVSRVLDVSGVSLAQVAGSQAEVARAVPRIEDSVVIGPAVDKEFSDSFYSAETKKLAPFNNGVLILPQSGEEISSSTVKELFSDEVFVTEDESGVLEAVRVDSEGEVVGESLPVVLVPVNQGEL